MISKTIKTKKKITPKQKIESVAQPIRIPYKLFVPSKLYVAVACIFASLPSMAQQEGARMEEQVVVGSRVAGRSAEDLAVPVDVLDADALSKTGQVEVGRMLQMSAPSFNFSSSSVSDGTDALRPATLRGLGPDQTLVLVNGKRRHQASLIHINTSVGRGTAGTDLNAIPAASIERIEILRDGAAAQYGSDAIAGIINIVLKTNENDGRLLASYGQHAEGDGQTLNLDFNKGLSLGDRGFFNLTANYRDRAHTNRADPQGGCLFGGCVDSDNNGYNEPAAGIGNKEVTARGRNGFRIGDADSEQFALVMNSSFSLDEGELYGFITYSRRKNESGAFYRNPTGSNGVDNALLSDGLNPADSEGFLPKIYSEIGDISYNFGYNVTFSDDTTFDLAYTHGRNAIDYTTRNSANYSYANYLQFEPGFNFSNEQIRAQIPREADAYGLRLGLTTINATLSKPVGDVNVALGAELREDSYQIVAGEPYAYADYDTNPETGDALYAQDAGGSIQGFNGISPVSELEETRNVTSFYVDAEYQAFDRWLLSGAVRYDEYGGFGDTLNYKFATAFDVVDNFKLRASASTGFRAPSMQQLYFNNISTQIRDAGAVVVGTFRNDSEVVKALGVPSLKEEESTNISVGFVWSAGDKFSLTTDFYAIDIKDRIVLSNQLSKSDDPGTGILEKALDAAGAEAAQFFLNGADTETRGVDVVARFGDYDLGAGVLGVTLAANINKTEVKDTYVPSSGAIGALDPSVVFSKQDISIIEEWQPQDRIILGGDYHLGAFAANLTFNRFGEYTVLDATSQTYSSQWLTDLHLAYDFESGLALFFTGNNIFDVTPDEATNTGSRGGLFESTAGAKDMASDSVFRYSRRSAPFGFNGAYYSLGVSYTF